MARHSIIIGTSDMAVLSALVAREGEARRRDDSYLRALAQELDRAKVVADHKVPADTVRLGCEVHIREAGSRARPAAYRIVLPEQASFEDGKVSVMSPIGTGLLGYRVGDTVTWPVAGGERTWNIERVEMPEDRQALARTEEAA